MEEEQKSPLNFSMEPELRQLISMFCRNGAIDQQEDAEEFLTFLLQTLHEEWVSFFNDISSLLPIQEEQDDTIEDWKEVNRKKKKVTITTQPGSDTQFSIITKLFYGIFQSEVKKIDKNSNTTVTHQSFQCLQLDIWNSDIRTLEDSLLSYFRKEVVDRSTSKQGAQKASKTVSLDSLPPILLLQLKQFTFSQDHGSLKLNKWVQYPAFLQIPKNLLSEKLKKQLDTKSGAYTKSEFQQFFLCYQLFGVILHHGESISNGHYTVFCLDKDQNSWKEYDDSKVNEVTQDTVLRQHQSGAPYLLLYIATDIIY